MFNQEIINTFWQSITVMGQGMTGIFIFMLIFFILIKVIDRVFPKEKD